MAKVDGVKLTKTEVIDSSKVDREKVRLAFEAYDAIDADIAEMKRALETKAVERSNAVKAILASAEGFSGPFNRSGNLVKIVQRDSVFFLRGRSDKGSFEVQFATWNGSAVSCK